MLRCNTQLNILFFMALITSSSWADDPCISLPTMAGPTVQDLPLCGNGIVDAGEICDDGNTVGSDGCNAWCTAFDRMTRPCTLAGQNYYYASQSKPKCLNMITSPTFSASEALFCNLNAIGISPDSSYMVVSDGGLIVRVDLFTDDVMNSMSILPATNTYSFTRFCSLFVLQEDDDDTIVAHECQAQSIAVFTSGGTVLTRPVSLPFLPSTQSRAYYSSSTSQIIYAGDTSY